MLCIKITCLFVLFQMVFLENKINQQRGKFFVLSKLVSSEANFFNNQSAAINGNNPNRFLQLHLPNKKSNSANHTSCENKCLNKNNHVILPEKNFSLQAANIQWIPNDSGTTKTAHFNSRLNRQMEVRTELSRKSAEFDLMLEPIGEEDDNNSDKNNVESGEKDEYDEDDDDDDDDDGDDEYDFSLLENDDKLEKPSKIKKHPKISTKNENEYDDDEDDTPELKHVFKHKFKMKDLMFLLLLAYKLKFVTLIPLFLGSLILLVGATSMAGFFFALFSAALGLQSKSHR